MQAQTMVKRRWFWAWQDEREEAWLESMAREGWHLIDVGFMTYIFEQGEPREDVYRLDFRTSGEIHEYIEFVRGAGWQFIGKMSSWLYFRFPAGAGGEADAGRTASANLPAELFTDAEGKITKYQRIIGILVVTSPAYWVVFLSQFDRYPPWFGVPMVAIFLSITGVYAFSMFKLIGRINQLKRT